MRKSKGLKILMYSRLLFIGVRLERAAKKPFIYNVPSARFENRLIQKGRWTFEQKKLQNSLPGSASVELALFAYQRVRWNIQNLPDPANSNFVCEVVSALFENSQFQKGRWKFVLKKLQISNMFL